MKKIFFLALTAFALLFSASCERKGTIFEMPDDSQLVSFTAKKAIVKMFATDGNKITVALNRGNTKGAASVPFTFKSEAEVFTPSKTTFDFADGEATATVDINYPDINAFGSEKYEMTIEVDETQISPSGIGELKITASRKLTPVLRGKGTFGSVYVIGKDWDQEIYNYEEVPTHYILPSCIEDGVDFEFDYVDGQIVWPETFFSGLLVSGYQIWMHVASAGIDEDGDLVVNIDNLFLPELGGYSLPDVGIPIDGDVFYFKFPEGFSF